MTTNKANPVDAAIKAAQEKANAAPAASESKTVELYKQSGNNEVATYVAPRQKTLDDLGSAGLDVDAFLKVNEFGLEIKGKEGLVDSITVAIDTSSKGLQVFEAIKFGNPAIYYKTYDGAKAVTGGLWNDAVRKAQLADPSARTYEGADITMKLIEDAMATVKGKSVVVGEKGLVLGHSTATTNKANLKAFIDAITVAGLRDTVVEAKITAERRTNKNGNVWGVLMFELLGEHNSEA